ncbi:MAG: hypothetical protein R2940_17125 [Syntrophotaleaceae bacterium]
MLRSLIMLILLVSLTACQSFFKVPKEEYREEVKTLGVLPLMVDEQSTIEHPEPQQVLALLQRHNTGRHPYLVELLREKKSYFDVRAISADPQQLYGRLIRNRSVRKNPEGPRYHYMISPETAAELCRQNAVDALLLVVLNGTNRVERRWDRTRLTYLESPYNGIQASALVVLPSGEPLWEYFGLVSEPFLSLQYPNFDEAHYNKTDQVPVHFVTIAGLERALTEPGTNWFQKTKLPHPYQELFQEMAGYLKPGMLNPFAKSPQENQQQ